MAVNGRAPRRRGGALVFMALFSGAAQGADLTVSAATSLTNAFKELAPAFEAQNPDTQLLFNFAASDALLAQIARGAPVDVFASADQQTMDRAEQRRLLLPGSRHNFVGNSLVLVTPIDGGLSLKSLSDLQKPGVRRVAIGRPDGVPAGRYAKSALEAAGLWPAVEPKAVYAQNVRQALDYVARGEVEAGFVYASDATAQKDRIRVLFSVPTQTPISYPVAVVAGAANADAARKFVDYLLSPTGQALLARHGFRKP